MCALRIIIVDVISIKQYYNLEELINLFIIAPLRYHYLHFSVLSRPLEIILLKRIYIFPERELRWPDSPGGSLFHASSHSGLQIRRQGDRVHRDWERLTGSSWVQLWRHIPMCLEEMSPTSSWLLACGDLCRTGELLLTPTGWRARGLKLYAREDAGGTQGTGQHVPGTRRCQRCQRWLGPSETKQFTLHETCQARWNQVSHYIH